MSSDNCDFGRCDGGGGDDDDETETTAAADPVHEFHVKAFLDMTQSLDAIREIGERGGTLLLPTDEARRSGGGDPVPTGAGAAAAAAATYVGVTVHASVMYYGDRLALSTETVRLTVSKRDYEMFRRVVRCYTEMVMGTYTNAGLQRLRDDHDHMLRRWDDAETKSLSADDPGRAVGDEIHKMIKNMLETPVYYTSSCMALIACGVMLRDLFRTTLNRDASDFDDLMDFVRRHMRHNPVYPFDCECGPEANCSGPYKTLLSLILELPPVIHNQTYMLQILAYLMYDKDGREEIFVLNMKNVVSPGLLDKIPTRLAMLVGSLDENVIKSRMRRLAKKNNTTGVPAFGRASAGAGACAKLPYNRVVLESLVALVHEPRIARLIDDLPGARNARVELVFERCKDRRVCVNADNAGDIYSPRDNNYGKNRCCGYLSLDPVGMLASSISALQLCVYLYTDTRQAAAAAQRHYFVRDIMVAMAKCSMNMDQSTLVDVFGYLDRCDVFKGFAHNPIFTATFYRLFQSYLKSMKNIAKRLQTKRRKVNRMLEKVTNGAVGGL